MSAGQLTNLFASLSRSRWDGADGAYSIPLADGRTVWAFGDTVTPAGGSSPLAMIHNSIVVTGAGQPRVFLSPIAPSPDGTFYWPAAGHAAGGSRFWLLLLRTLVNHTGLHIVGNSLAYMDANTGRVLSQRAVPGSNGTVPWGNELFDWGRYTYIYGVEYQGANLQQLRTWLHVARVPAGRLDLPWSYYTGRGWSSNAAASARTLAGVSGSPALVQAGVGLRLVSQEGELGHRVLSWRAASPVGPFTGEHVVYTIPNMGPRTFVYLAHPHPEFSTAQATMFSFSTNVSGWLTSRTVSLYRPRFFTISNATLYGSRLIRRPRVTADHPGLWL